jgi:hypothetical protein
MKRLRADLGLISHLLATVFEQIKHFFATFFLAGLNPDIVIPINVVKIFPSLCLEAEDRLEHSSCRPPPPPVRRKKSAQMGRSATLPLPPWNRRRRRRCYAALPGTAAPISRASPAIASSQLRWENRKVGFELNILKDGFLWRK